METIWNLRQRWRINRAVRRIRNTPHDGLFDGDGGHQGERSDLLVPGYPRWAALLDRQERH